MVARVHDAITLDHLRTLIAVVEEGSFSAAGRKLRRAQSAVSMAMANLEVQLSVPLFDRSTKIPALTEQGRAVLTAARRVAGEVDALRRLTSGMVMGLEAQLSLCVDALFPLRSLVALCRDFAAQFPAVDLRVDTQSASAVAGRVKDGSATLGVVSVAGLPSGLERQPLAAIAMVAVVAPQHPLARLRGPVATARFADSIQLLLAERVDAKLPDQCVLSSRTWKIADLRTKHEMVRAGLGWGNLPEHVVGDDVLAGRLVALSPRAWGERERRVPLAAIYRSDTPFGPARRWVLAQLGGLCVREGLPPPQPSARVRQQPARRTQASKRATPRATARGPGRSDR